MLPSAIACHVKTKATHSHPLTTPIGASRYSNDRRPTSPAMLLPTPPLLPASCTITILPVFFTVSASAALGSGFMERTSMSWIEGAGFGGRNLAGKKGRRDGGGFCRSRMARTGVSRCRLVCDVVERTAGVQRRAVRDEREV